MVDIYKRITARIIEQLERGSIPWRKPWSGGEAGHPRNLASGHHYRGVNVFLLGTANHQSHYWLTFKQALALGGHVRKGERSTPVIYWRWLEREDPEHGEIVKVPLLRQYNVFNIAQCELPPDKVPENAATPENDFEPIDACERLAKAMPNAPTLIHGGGVASYRPASDSVQMPNPQRFSERAEYYSTLFHELTHSTGHASRLNRPGITGEIRFGSRDYSKEELIAEMGAAYLCGHCGIDNAVIENSSAYIAGWLQRLRGDSRLVIHAAAAAQKAADFIRGTNLASAIELNEHEY